MEAQLTPLSLVRRVVDACNSGDLAILDGVLTPPTGRSDLRNHLAAFRAAVPDARWTIVEQVAQGDRVVTRLCVQGTFSGPLVGLAPPGRPATLSGIAISRIVRGRLVKLWVQADLLDFLQQLQVLPPLDLAQAATMARVLHAGTVLADGLPP